MKKLGFTLAEVLITLVIIGVIAAMTVPTLMNNTNAQEFRSALKKAISGVNQALTLHYALEGLGAQDYSTAQSLIDDVFKKRMNVIDQGTYNAGYTVGGLTPTTENSFITQDGIIFVVNDWSVGDVESQEGACNSYNTKPCIASDAPNLWIDVNGEKNPNRITTNSTHPRDQYQAQIYNQKVVPYGTPTQEVMFDKEVSTGAAT